MSPDAFTGIRLFAELPRDGLDRLALAGRERQFPVGHVLMRQGETAEVLYVLMEGRVRVERVRGDDEPLILAELGPGEVVGEMGVLDREPRFATVTALQDTTAMEVAARPLELVLLQYPEVSATLLHVFSQRLRSNAELAESILSRVRTERQQSGGSPDELGTRL